MARRVGGGVDVNVAAVLADANTAATLASGTYCTDEGDGAAAAAAVAAVDAAGVIDGAAGALGGTHADVYASAMVLLLKTAWNLRGAARAHAHDSPLTVR